MKIIEPEIATFDVMEQIFYIQSQMYNAERTLMWATILWVEGLLYTLFVFTKTFDRVLITSVLSWYNPF